jgi:hypothetical protein
VLLQRKDTVPIPYSVHVRQRGDRALRCSPFLPQLFRAMQQGSIALLEIAAHKGVEAGFTRSPLPALVVEAELDWLIQVGLLRREVDGQGLTDRYRLTPLGQSLLEELATQDWSASWGDRLQNLWNRWFHP